MPPVIRLFFCLMCAAMVGRLALRAADASSQPTEFRGAWVASVNNIDWPSKPGMPTKEAKAELVRIIQKAAQLKLNVLIFQVRPACDALYVSNLEPWSEYLTGAMGRPPNPLWDPLEVAIYECHKRGIELHAWVNPFRARHSKGFSPISNDHVSRKHPLIAKNYGTSMWLDPGLKEVHDYSARVILDIVKRYDVDGIHIDDYFYPYREKDAQGKEIPFPDWTSWNNYVKGGGKLARDDWRRDNVNRFIARMYREVKAAKPNVQVGISPFGIYRPGYPAQIKGFDQYESIYADPRTWLANGWLDYIVPQIYWRVEPPQTSFPVLLKWWAENNPKNKLIVAGMNSAQVGGSKGWVANDIVREIEITRAQPGVGGHVHWNFGALMKNKGGLADELAQKVYTQPARVPGAVKKN
jgi:uncharacterized lipoprotein YddW (UPF0748 family)